MTIKTITKLILLLSAVFFMVFEICVSYRNNQISNYVLKAKNNKLVLFENNTIIKEYNDVVINNLPIIDKERLKSGIIVSNENEAEKIVENFDG